MARVCVEEGRLEVVQAQHLYSSSATERGQQAHLSVEKDKDNCWTLHAEPGVAIDGFIVRRRVGQPWGWVLTALAGVSTAIWGLDRWRRRRS